MWSTCDGSNFQFWKCYGRALSPHKAALLEVMQECRNQLFGSNTGGLCRAELSSEILGALMLLCELFVERSTKIFSRNPRKRCIKKMCLWFKSLYVQLIL